MSEPEKPSAEILPFRGPRQKKAPPCPICEKPSQPDYRPFCSKRCANIDLGRWLNGSYRVPTEEPAPLDEGESRPADHQLEDEG